MKKEINQLEKGTKVKVISTQYKGLEGIIISEDMYEEMYLVQLQDGIKGLKPHQIETLKTN